MTLSLSYEGVFYVYLDIFIHLSQSIESFNGIWSDLTYYYKEKFLFYKELQVSRMYSPKFGLISDVQKPDV